jgi:tRNA A37 threonylcarbamoyladenosine modification protein TsaB
MMDKTPSSSENCLILFSSALEFRRNKKITMNDLIIDAASEKIFLMLIKDKNIYSVSHENSKTNYEKLTILINDFLDKNDIKIVEISKVYVNRGPGSFAGIRNSLAVVKAIYVAKQIDYYCFSFDDFDKSYNNKYEDIPSLCNKLKVKKNLINPIYIS